MTTIQKAQLLQNHIIIRLLLNMVPSDVGDMSEEFKKLLESEIDIFNALIGDSLK